MTENKRYPYTKRLKLVKAGTGEENIDDEPVKEGRILVLTSISLEDETSALTKARIGKVTAGYYHPWEEQDTPAQNELVFSTEEHWLRTGDKFRAVVTGGAADDIIFVYLDGYWKKWKE